MARRTGRNHVWKQIFAQCEMTERLTSGWLPPNLLWLASISSSNKKKKTPGEGEILRKGPTFQLAHGGNRSEISAKRPKAIIRLWAIGLSKRKKMASGAAEILPYRKKYVTVYNFGYNTQCSKSFPNEQRIPIQSNGGS